MGTDYVVLPSRVDLPSNHIQSQKTDLNISYLLHVPWMFIILCFSEFDQIDITCLTILVGRVVGYINSLFLISAGIPVIQKGDDLIAAHCAEQSAHRHIAVDLHLISEKRMVERKIRIVLTGVILIDD